MCSPRGFLLWLQIVVSPSSWKGAQAREVREPDSCSWWNSLLWPGYTSSFSREEELVTHWNQRLGNLQEAQRFHSVPTSSLELNKSPRHSWSEARAALFSLKEATGNPLLPSATAQTSGQSLGLEEIRSSSLRCLQGLLNLSEDS